ncbi:MAG: FtsX-like permease family protein [Christensenellales bacterium]|jgi:putative ABC transport system permease protein
MVKSALRNSALREVKNSLGRYLAILAIVALGVGFFSGLRVSRDAMIRTGDTYLARLQFYDYRLISTVGFSRGDAAAFRALAGVVDAEGSVTADALYAAGDASGGVLKIHSLTERVNRVSLVAGRMPERADEIVVDSRRFGADAVGTSVTLLPENEEDTLALFHHTSFTIVGTVNSPSYLNYERGGTSLGNGTVDGFAYLPREGFASDYDTEIYVVCDVPGAIYSDDYTAGIADMEDGIAASGEARANARYQSIVGDAQTELADGQAEYDEGLLEYREARADAEAELRDAREALADGAREIEEHTQTLEDGEAELADARDEHAAGAQELAQARTALRGAERTAYAELDGAQTEVEGNLAAARDGIAQIEESGIIEQYAALEAGIAELSAGLDALASAREQLMGAGDALRGGIAQAQAGIDALQAQKKQAQTDWQTGRAAIEQSIAALEGEIAALDPGDDARIAQLDAEIAALKTEQARVSAEIAAQQDDYAARIEQAESDKHARDAQLAQAQANLDGLQSARDAEIGARTSEIAAAKAARDALDPETQAEEIAAHNARIAQLEGEIASIESAYAGQIADAESQVNSAQAQASQAQEAVDSLISARDAALAALASERSGIESGIADAENERAGLTPSPDAQRRKQLETQIESARAELDALDVQFTAAQTAYDEQIAQITTQKQALENQLSAHEASFDKNLETIDAQSAALSEQLSQAIAAKAQIEGAGYPDQFRQLQAAIPQLEAGLSEIAAQRAAADAQFADAWRALDDGDAALASALIQINRARAELTDGREQLARAKTELEGGYAEYDDAAAQAEAEFDDAEQTLSDAARELSDARAKIAEIEAPDVYVLDRTTNVGYMSFDSDAQIVHGISRVFPLFFFMVAALVCMTTMTRMVDEQRTQIGVLKALGYAPGAILWKYVFYAGSAAALGSVIGFFGGSALFPKVIWMAYDIMYGFAPLQPVYDWGLGAASLAVSLFCAVGATWFAVKRDLARTPAALLRPQAPKAGKRIFLERVTPLWRRLTFLQKVAIRNIFRYKKRLVMMIIGIGGCTALLVTGLGIRDSVRNVVDHQYDEITVYDIAVHFVEPQDARAQVEMIESGAEDWLFLHEGAAEASAGGVTKTINLIATDAADISAYLDLHDNEARVSPPGAGEAVISRGLHELTGAGVGDEITVRDGDMREMRLTVSGVFDNYVYHYVYVRAETCRALWGYAPDVKTAYVNAPENADLHRAAARIADLQDVGNVSVNLDVRARVGSMMDGLDSVILLVVFSAGALAFIVLYNLTNINITERTREIATIKVLGFYPKETASYVFSENLILCMISALAGLPLGKWLHAFVMSQIRIDMMYFRVRILAPSYLIAVALTLAFAGLVHFVLRFKLEKIDMAQSLKTVE